MNFLSAVGLLLLAALPIETNHYCTTVCMSKFQKSILDITGSAESSTLMAPFHKIISATEDNKSTYKQIRMLCAKVKGWETCVRSCSRDSAREIFLSSMEQWKKFCAMMRKPTKANSEYLNCERDYLQQVSQKCDSQMPETFSIATFCNSFEKYRKCFEQFIYRCSDEAFVIKKAIDEAIQQSFEKLMKFTTNRIRLPNRCNVYHHSRQHQHRRKQSRGEVVPYSHAPPIFPTGSERSDKETSTSFTPTTPLKLSCDCGNHVQCSEQCHISNETIVLKQPQDVQPGVIDFDEMSKIVRIEETKQSELLINSYPNFHNYVVFFATLMIFS